MAQSNPTFSDSIQDPDDLLQDQADMYSKEISQSRSAQDFNATVANRGAQIAGGGGPQVLQAQALKTRMQQIMMQANDGADPNEDPLSKNMRIASLMGQGLMDLNPQMAMKAMEQAARYQEAAKQQQYLGAETGHVAAETQDLQNKNTIFQNSPQSMLLVKDLGKDKNGLPLGLATVGSYDLKNSDSASKMRNDIVTGQQNGDTLIPMSPQDVYDKGVNLAAASAQARLQAAQIAATERLQAAVMRGQGGTNGLGVNGNIQVGRVVNAVAEGVGALQNAVMMPIGANAGLFGIGSTPGQSLLHSSIDSLRNTLSSSEVQRYNTQMLGLNQNLAMIENSGLLPRGTFTENFNRVMFRAGDTQDGITALTKLAEAKQIITNGTKSLLSNPKVPQEWKDEVSKELDNLSAAIPYTNADVNKLQSAKDRKATVGDMIVSKMNAPSSGATQPNGAPGSKQTYSDQDLQDAVAAGWNQNDAEAEFKKRGFTKQ